jgi:hypothetical protein
MTRPKDVLKEPFSLGKEMLRGQMVPIINSFDENAGSWLGPTPFDSWLTMDHPDWAGD